MTKAENIVRSMKNIIESIEKNELPAGGYDFNKDISYKDITDVTKSLRYIYMEDTYKNECDPIDIFSFLFDLNKLLKKIV